MRALHRALLLSLTPLLLSSLASCASNDVEMNTLFDPLARFPSSATYAWDEGANSLPDKPRILELNPDALIRGTADAAFADRGYRVVTSAEPDYLLSYELNVATVISSSVQRSIGSLWLVMRENATKDRVWAGFLKADVNVALSDEARRTAMAASMQRLLKRFPPNTAAD